MRALTIAILLTACGPVDDDPDAGTSPDGGPRWQLCEDACANLQALGCPAGEPAEDGSECYESCHDLEEILPGAFHTKCVTNADSCEAADACFE